MCPICKRKVDEVGPILPMQNIRRVVGEIKENCGYLRDILSWESGSDGKPYQQPPFLRNLAPQPAVDSHDEIPFASPSWGSIRSFDIHRTTNSPSPFSIGSPLASGASSFRDELPVPDSTVTSDSHLQSPIVVQDSPMERWLSQNSSKSPVILKTQDHAKTRPHHPNIVRSSDQNSSQEDRSRNPERSFPSTSRLISRTPTLFSPKCTRRNSRASLVSEAPSIVQSLKNNMSVVNLGQGKEPYQGTAISPTCLAIALINRLQFQSSICPKRCKFENSRGFPSNLLRRQRWTIRQLNNFNIEY